MPAVKSLLNSTHSRFSMTSLSATGVKDALEDTRPYQSNSTHQIILPFAFNLHFPRNLTRLSALTSNIYTMPAVWGQKYLDELGAESWEEIHRLCEEKLERDDIKWDAKNR